MSRRILIGSAVSTWASIAVLRYPASAAEYTFKFAVTLPSSHPTTICAFESAKNIEAESGGRLQVQVFPNNALGDDIAVMSQIRSGAVQLYSGNGQILSTIVPVAAIEAVAFAFANYQRVGEAMDGPLGAYIRESVRRVGLYPFDRVWYGGFHQVSNSKKAIERPEDLQGLKLRIAPGRMELDIYRALGATAAPVPAAELYSALQTHLVDGAVTSLGSYEAFKLYEVQRYLSLTQHSFVTQPILSSNDTMQALPPALREIVNRNISASGLRQRAMIISSERSLEKALRDQGMLVNRPDRAALQDEIRKARLYQQWQAQFGTQPWTLLESVTGPLAES